MENKVKEKIEPSRNGAIDLARIISMLMVVILHIQGHGGLLSGATGGMLYVVKFSEQLCIIGVNLFALITGYVWYGKKFKLKNIISLWFQVLFYSLVITIIVSICQNTQLTFQDIIKMFLPVSNKLYWYFSSYVLLFFLIPVINIVIEKTDKKQSIIFLSIILFLCCVLNSKIDVFTLNNGYSSLWLAVMASIGAFIKKYNFNIKIKNYVFVS